MFKTPELNNLGFCPFVVRY